MGKVRVIEAKKPVTASAAIEPARKIKVAAYARVSTDHSDQETSYEAQQTHFTSLIENNPSWELVDIYADEESGTRADKRENFMRMIADCEAGKIQMVLTKSISRFARNTLDCLKYIRRLKALEIPILFTKESINTMDAGGEVLVTILASIAQQESASISQNVQIGVRYHYQEGKVCSGVHRLLGYNRTREGNLELVPHEAMIVRRIFRDYLDGYNIGHIVERLKADSIDGSKTTANGFDVPRKWNYEGLDYLLQNEKYSGDLLLQKYYTVDYLTKKVAVNEGQVPQYLAENNHPPVIPKEVFLQTQAEMARRRQNPSEFHYLHNWPLAGRIICGECGCCYRRISDKRYGTANYRCEARALKYKHPDIDCHSKGVREEKIQAAVIEAFNRLPEVEAELVRLDERLKWVGIQKADELLSAIRERMLPLEEEKNPTDDQRRELEELHGQWAEASAQRAIYADKEVQIKGLLQRIAAIKGMDDGKRDTPEHGACADTDEFWTITRTAYKPGPITEFPDDEVIRFVEKIVVEPDRFIVSFKAGVSIEIERKKK